VDTEITDGDSLAFHGIRALTKREYFAAMALSACVAQGYIAGVAAPDAVAYADALIQALNAREGEG
jgi:hypothetical protein